MLKNAKIVIESDLCANVRIFALMNVSSHYWSPFHSNDCVFSRIEQQEVYKKIPEILVWNFWSVRAVGVVYHFLSKIPGLWCHATLDSSYNMRLVRN